MALSFHNPIKESEILKCKSHITPLITVLIVQNIYLFAASFGIAAWLHNCDKENTAREFNLKPIQRVLFAQTLEYLKYEP
ncbi:MAG: hypothetical protein HXX14_19230 [Bacteroidetes bacterium]|nr:hypothetical protein [Bacteroidota bacterium]